MVSCYECIIVKCKSKYSISTMTKLPVSEQGIKIKTEEKVLAETRDYSVLMGVLRI